MANKVISSTMAAFAEARKSQGITQAKVSELMGWATPQNIKFYEQGVKQPSILAVESMLSKIGYHLEIVKDNEQNTK